MGCGSSSSAGAPGTVPTASGSGAAYQINEPNNENNTKPKQSPAIIASTTVPSNQQPLSNSVSPSAAGTGRQDEPSGGEGHPNIPHRKSVNSKRLTLPLSDMPASHEGGVGTTTTLNLALINPDEPPALNGGNHSQRGKTSARGKRSSGSSKKKGSTPPGSARGRGEDGEHDILVSIPFFESLDNKSIRKLRDAFQRRKYAAGEWISRSSPVEGAKEGDADFFLVISGTIQLSVRVLTSKTAAPGKDKSTPKNQFLDPTVLPPTESEDITLATLKDGQWFGVEALVQDSFQKADILALSDCVLLAISRESFRKFSQDIPSMQTNIADVVTNTRVSLRSLPFFATVDELKLQQLSQLLEFRRFEAGDVIIREGDAGDGFYIIVNGTAKVTVQTKDNGTFLLSTLIDGNYFGEQSLLNGGPRLATVSAATPMLLLFLSAQRFHRFERLAPEVFSDSFKMILAHRTTQVLKTIPLFDVLCLDKRDSQSDLLNDSGSQNKLVDVSQEAGSTPVDQSKPVLTQSYDEKKLGLLASLFDYESHPAKTVVFREGDRANKLFIIIRGSVEVSTMVESGRVVLNTLHQSAFFGEIVFLFPTVRSATITTLEPCLFLSLAADKFARFITIAPELKEKLSFAVGPRVASIIENIPFFRNEIRENKPWSKLGLLGELCQFEKAEENEVIFKQGDDGDKFYVIIQGAVLVTKVEEPSESEDGTRRLSGSLNESPTHGARPSNVPGVILRRGNYFGEESLGLATAGDVKRWGTVISLSLSVFLTLSRSNFEKYVKIAPELKELILSRHQTSAEQSQAPPVRGTKMKRVAENQSLHESPIFSTEDQADLHPTKLAYHPQLLRLQTTGNVPLTVTKTRTPAAMARATTLEPSSSSSDKILHQEALSPKQQSSPPPSHSLPNRPPSGTRLPSLPTLVATGSSSTDGGIPVKVDFRKPSLLSALSSGHSASRSLEIAMKTPKEIEAYQLQNMPPDASPMVTIEPIR